jgi:shikimate kinase
MADIETIVDRIMRDPQNNRPLANTEADIRKLISERYAYYTSQQVIYTIGKSESPETIINNIRQLIIR